MPTQSNISLSPAAFIEAQRILDRVAHRIHAERLGARPIPVEVER
jgi:hypothetical protein